MEDGERWEGEFEAAAREAYLRRMENLANGWHPRGWVNSAARRDHDPLTQQQLDEGYAIRKPDVSL